MSALGTGILLRFKYNPIKAVMAAYPEHEFLPWKFRSVFKHYWKKTENLQALMKWVGSQLNYTCMEDWYKITTENLIELECT